MKMKKLGLLFMMLCMVFAVNAQELKKGDKLPDFHLKSAVYGDVSSAELKGKVVLVAYLYWLLKQRLLFPPQYHAGHSMAVL